MVLSTLGFYLDNPKIDNGQAQNFEAAQFH
jgi:hypothetical protein